MNQDERTKELLEWALRFSSMKLEVEDVRYPIRAHVAKIVEHIRQQPNLSVFTDDEIRELGRDRAEMVRQLDICRSNAVAVAVTAKLEQDNEARKTGGKATVEARKRDAETRKAKVEGEARRLRSKGTAEHKLISEIMKATGYSRTTVTTYLPKK